MSRRETVRYEENPFIKDMVVPVKGKKIQISAMGANNSVLVNQSTGEVQGTHITTYKQVDSEQFVKLFTANIGLTFDLKSAGLKALNVLMWGVQNYALAKDQIDLEHLTLETFLKSQEGREPPIKLSLATFTRGINELESAQIVAKTIKKGRYFINPNFIFNGDRIAFTTLIERKKKSNKRDENTPDMFTGLTESEASNI